MAVTNTTIDMTWTAATDNVGVVSYHIYQSTDNVVYTEIHSTDGATYAYTAIGLSEDTKYYFKQTAKDAAGNESLYGNTVEATTLGEVGYTYLLDDYPGAVAAYSLRKLRTGEVNAVEVRRDNDNATTNVLLYDDPSKSIDLLSEVTAGGTLGDWANTDSVFVTAWFDQSGGNINLIQTAPELQPLLISIGVINIDNNQPSIDFNGSSQCLYGWYNTTAPIIWQSIQDPISDFIVHTPKVVSTAGVAWAPGLTLIEARQYEVSIDVPLSQGITTSTLSIGAALDGSQRLNIGNTTYLIGTQYLSESYIITDICTSYTNSSADNTADFSGIAGDRTLGTLNSSLTVGVRTRNGAQMDANYYNGGISEIVFYPLDQTANRAAIETDINNHYNIWVVTAEVDAQLIQADNDGLNNTVLEINGVRSSASDSAVTNLISRNVTIITN